MGSESQKTPKKTTTRSNGSAGRSRSSTTKISTTESSTKSTAKSSSTKTAPGSAKDKLEKSLKGLSFAGGGVGSSKIDLGPDITKTSNDKSRKKVGGVVLDLDTIQDANKQKLSAKSNRRNTVIIIVLAVLLVLSLAYLAVTLMAYFRGKKEPCLRYEMSTEVDANWLIEGNRRTEFAIRQGLESGMVYEIDSKLQVNTIQRVNISITLTIRVAGEEIVPAGLLGLNPKFINAPDTSHYVYQGGLEGGGIIDVFTGIDFKGAPSHLSSDNVQIIIKATLTFA